MPPAGQAPTPCSVVRRVTPSGLDHRSIAGSACRSASLPRQSPKAQAARRSPAGQPPRPANPQRGRASLPDAAANSGWPEPRSVSARTARRPASTSGRDSRTARVSAASRELPTAPARRAPAATGCRAEQPAGRQSPTRPAAQHARRPAAGAGSAPTAGPPDPAAIGWTGLCCQQSAHYPAASCRPAGTAPCDRARLPESAANVRNQATSAPACARRFRRREALEESRFPPLMGPARPPAGSGPVDPPRHA